MATILYILITILTLGGDLTAQECRIYPNTAFITEVDTENDIVYCLDLQGEEWSFYNADGWKVDDCVSLLMYNNMTCEDITDDIILTQKFEFQG